MDSAGANRRPSGLLAPSGVWGEAPIDLVPVLAEVGAAASFVKLRDEASNQGALLVGLGHHRPELADDGGRPR